MIKVGHYSYQRLLKILDTLLFFLTYLTLEKPYVNLLTLFSLFS